MRGTAEDLRVHLHATAGLHTFVDRGVQSPSASLNTRSTSFHDPTSAPIVQAAMGWQVGAEQTLILGGAGAAAADIVAP